MFLWLANWWDGVDLWLSQLAFPFQFAIVIAVLAPVCFGLALVVDRVVDLVSGRVTRPRDEPAPAAQPLVRADVPAGTPGTIITPVPDPTDEADADADADTEQVTATAGRGTESAGS